MKASQRGAALAIVIVTALVCAIAAYGILIMASGQARRALAFQQRLKARYASEAGLWIVMAKLQRFPDYPSGAIPGYPSGAIPGTTVKTSCAAPGGGTARAVEQIDFNGDGPDTHDPVVEVTVTNCGANRTHRITTRVVY